MRAGMWGVGALALLTAGSGHSSDDLLARTMAAVGERAIELELADAEAGRAVVEIFERMKQDVDLYIHKECGRKREEE